MRGSPRFLWLASSCLLSALAGVTPNALAATSGARIGEVQTISAPGQITPSGATVGCPGEARPLSGGILQEGPPSEDINLNADGPVDNTQTTLGTNDGDRPQYWVADVRNTGPTTNYKVLPVCAHANVRIEESQFKIAYGERIRKTAMCPHGRRAVGGGVLPSGLPDQIFIGESGPVDANRSFASTRTGDVPKGWAGSAFQLADSNGKVTIRVFAVCARGSDARLEAVKQRIDAFQTTSGIADAYADCPGRQRAIGGGFLHNAGTDSVFAIASGPLDRGGTFAGTVAGDVPRQWYAAARNATDNRVTMKVLAICE